MIRRNLFSFAILATVVASLLAPTAAAWGPRAKRYISVMALQVIKNDYQRVFRSEELTGPNFELDVLRGSDDGYIILGNAVPLNNRTEVIQAIQAQIRLLRDASEYEPSSYFAYRMGMLSALVADVVMPYGFAWNAEEVRIQKQINDDINKVIERYRFTSTRKDLVYIRSLENYLNKHCSFYDSDKRIIGEDYRKGVGYRGFLKRGGEVYFKRSVAAVADVWHTILKPGRDPADIKTTKEKLIWYFVREIEYLVKQKHNLNAAERVYENFVTINPGLAETYERVGDIYYEYGKSVDDYKIINRGVQEWSVAYDLAVLDRVKIATKLHDHYIDTGQFYLDRSKSVSSAEETDLNTALNAFEQALQYLKTSDTAANYIHSTNVAIKERNERFEATLGIIASGDRAMQQADAANANDNFAEALDSYRDAIGFYEKVTEEFKAEKKKADDNIRDINFALNSVINKILDGATEKMRQGEQYLDTNNFDQAISAFKQVPVLLEIIPDDEFVRRDQKAQRDEMITDAATKLKEAQDQKTRLEQAGAQARPSAQ